MTLTLCLLNVFGNLAAPFLPPQGGIEELPQQQQAAQAVKKQKLSSRHKQTSLTQSFSYTVGYGSMSHIILMYVMMVYILRMRRSLRLESSNKSLCWFACWTLIRCLAIDPVL